MLLINKNIFVIKMVIRPLGVPTEYEPPNFEPAKELICSNGNSVISLGTISTGFHKISSWGRGVNVSFFYVE